MASACVGDYIEVRDEAMTELLADGYGPVVTSNDLGICSALLSSYFALTREVKYCQAQGHSETSNIPKKQLNEN